ncbi:hypothetical protein GGC63_006258 [Paenibacillus sp. OAS669]|nr:hypothetical protein [Paenibacillus sp. OAS669]
MNLFLFYTKITKKRVETNKPYESIHVKVRLPDGGLAAL